ncbi:Essential recombination function protein [uncultured Caudovirales phage]|uniref:Essential recombination function protein n=1 Tax=uncultured Caudovirales phage TaxID=2100421 RepID=A0A6J5KX54_9CAUD|nr:Essential recombination function protein [uncultured Caudovirales phage]
METKTKIFSKLLEFQNSIEVIKKDGKNSFFKKPDGKASTYATLPNILAEVKPIINALKLVVTQPIINGEVYTVITDTESGESIDSAVPLPTGLNPQQLGSAITYFRRYTLSSLLALEIDEDDDGNKASEPKFQSTTHDKPWLNKFEKDKVTLTEAWTKATQMVGNQEVTIAKIEDKYKLSKELKAELIQIQLNGN